MAAPADLLLYLLSLVAVLRPLLGLPHAGAGSGPLNFWNLLNWKWQPVSVDSALLYRETYSVLVFRLACPCQKFVLDFLCESLLVATFGWGGCSQEIYRMDLKSSCRSQTVRERCADAKLP